MRHLSKAAAGRLNSELQFMAIVTRTARQSDECWEWPGQRNSLGYGIFSKALAHRVVYERLTGEQIPDGYDLDHLCRNPPCVNPRHLEPVTHRENLLRGTGFAATNAQKTHCAGGHPFDEENTYVSPKGQRKCRACNRERMRG